ncbi:MAG: hypothetical protein G3M70_09435 [Candidatus Nitronauta litoralis]|uniref:Uncharacterized protein n=1 Tax=Candidatus Nitronauta litoralis TaxID=2705533 RepID=A0A7T0BW96_9BACT|nr:MAG: hypothetical protein G3M70_09435 [Candidatus Nitronauta litoralis]
MQTTTGTLRATHEATSHNSSPNKADKRPTPLKTPKAMGTRHICVVLNRVATAYFPERTYAAN